MVLRLLDCEIVAAHHLQSANLVGLGQEALSLDQSICHGITGIDRLTSISLLNHGKRTQTGRSDGWG